MSTAEWIALLLLCTAVSFTPGPNTTLSTALAANFGLRRALRFVLAVPLGWGLLLGLCASGIGALVLPVLLGFAQASNLSYALVGTLLRRWLSDAQHGGRRLRWFNRSMAAVLVLTAGWMATL